MFVVISHFKAQAEWRNKLEEAFLSRPRLVDEQPGFIKMDILQKQDDPDQFWLYTTWKDEESYDVWHKSHHYKDSHHGMPKGLKLVQESVGVLRFTH